MRLLTTSTEIHETLVELLGQHTSYSVAVAWATLGFDAQRLLVRNKAKIRRLVVGSDSYITDPDFLSLFVGDPSVRWMPQGGRLFHPKVYLLESGDSWDCIVGSANFTQGGMEKNEEVAIHTSSEDDHDHSMPAAVAALIEGYWHRAQPFDEDDLNEYAAERRARAGDRRRLRQRFTPTTANVRRKRRGAIADGLPDLLTMSWEEYYREIRGGEHPEAFEPRLDLLERVRTWFGYNPHLQDMDVETRACIAGTRNPGSDEIDWFWFGSMVGAGHFKNLILESPAGLSRALDSIPLTGEVERDHYEEFRKRFADAFAHLSRGGKGIATATRLLCMRRPDWFICLDGPNKRVCRAVGASMDLGLDGYWDRLIAPLTTRAPWWSEREPEDAMQKRAWIGRVAMLDAIFYEGAGP